MNLVVPSAGGTSAQRMLAVAILGGVLLGVVVDARSAYGYNEDGHFYTVTAVEHDREPPFEGGSRDEAVLTAFCAQLPDLANQLDATTLRANLIFSFSGTFWGAFSRCWSEDVRHMVAVHQYLHGLTDTAAQPVTDVAVAIIKTLRRQEESHPDPNTACAIGFAIHLLGDSFAHRQLHGSTDHMYAPGMGHFRDNHDPDYIDFTEDRMKLWETYTNTLADALQIRFDQSRWTDLRKVVESNLGGTEDNYFNSKEIIKGLRETLNDNGGIPIWAKYDPPVEDLTSQDSWYGQHVLSRDFRDVVTKYTPPLHYTELTYEQVWGTYESVAIKEFEREKITAACPPDSIGQGLAP